MKSEEKKIELEVNIGGQRFSVNVPFARQDAVRYTEYELGKIFEDWHKAFPQKTPQELFAMMAYRYASFYFDLMRRHEADTEEAEDLLEEVRRLARGVETDENESYPD